MPEIAPTAYEFRSAISQLERVLLETYLPSTHSCREPILPSTKELDTANDRILAELPREGVGLTGVTHHLMKHLLPAMNDSSLSPHYYGFVTGGVTPAALVGDMLATIVDQNVQVHLPEETICTTLESRTLEMLLDLFQLPRETWKGRCFTTGATASNILGLACAREALLRDKLVFAGYGFADASIAELGFLEACLQSRVMGMQVLSAMPHSSIAKAAAVVGIGRQQVKSVSLAEAPWEFDMFQLEAALEDGAKRGIVSIIVAGYGEVNTGRFVSNLRDIRALVSRYGSAWIHVDAAFGIFARVFSRDSKRGSTNGMAEVASWAEQIEYADSIAGDGHKLLNVVGLPRIL
jgi:glutamate/tyrosine decarboxylase-like PLP-dependent enzyme